MNKPMTHAHRPQHWLKDVQFALGLVVTLGGAGVVVAHLLQQLVGG